MNNFCSNCGTALNPEAKFCSKCGSPVNSDANTGKEASVISTNQSNDEEYAYILSAQYKKGVLSSKACTLLFTDSEVITAMVDNSLMKQHIAATKDQAKDKGFMKRTAAVMKSGYTFKDRYIKMPRQDVLSESSGNFSLPYSSVLLARFRKGTTTNYSDETTSTTLPSLVLKTTAGKFTYEFRYSVDTKTFLPFLQGCFPGKYKGPKR